MKSIKHILCAVLIFGFLLLGISPALASREVRGYPVSKNRDSPSVFHNSFHVILSKPAGAAKDLSGEVVDDVDAEILRSLRLPQDDVKRGYERIKKTLPDGASRTCLG